VKARLVALVWVVLTGTVQADVKSRAAAELAESMIAKFGAKAGTAATLAARIETLIARHGEDAVLALRKVGPEAFGLIEGAGANSARAAKLLAQHGEAGASLILRRPAAMQQVARFGEEAASVLIQHPGVAESVVENGGASAVQALGKVTQQGARRMAMVLEGELKAKPELLEVVAKYGQRACDFIWANKGSLAVGTVLATFLANPEPYLNGTVKLATVATEKSADAVAKPIAEGVGRRVNWTLIFLLALAYPAVFILWRFGKTVKSFPR
jgi:hypothetical protein